LASAAAAAAFQHDHNGKGHVFRGDPCTPPPAGEPAGGIQHVPGPHVTETANRLDPHNHGAQQVGSGESGQIGQHHRTRDTALVGAGAAATGAAYEAERHSDDHPGHQMGSDAADTTSKGVAPHKSSLLNKLDPRVKSTSDQSGHQDTTNNEPKDHHLGRDAALAGGAGVAVTGAYEAYEKHKDGNSAGGVGGGVVTGERGVIGSENNPYSSSALDPRVDSPDHRKSAGISSQSQAPDQHHYGRDAAIATGAGAAGTGVYEASKHHSLEHDTSNLTPSTANSKPMDGHQDQIVTPHHPAQQTGHGNTQVKHEHSTGRDAAAVGAVGAAGLGAEHEFSKKDAEKFEKARQKDLEKHEKEAAKAEKKHEKEVEKEHKPGLISRILHRDKDKSKHDDDPLASDSKHRKEEAAVGAGAVGTGVATHEHNKLHKDPPKQYQQHGASTTGGQHMGTDGPIGDPNRISGVE
jgi:hypothetical protein